VVGVTLGLLEAAQHQGEERGQLVAEFLVELLAGFRLGLVQHHEQRLRYHFPKLVKDLAHDVVYRTQIDVVFLFQPQLLVNL